MTLAKFNLEVRKSVFEVEYIYIYMFTWYFHASFHQATLSKLSGNDLHYDDKAIIGRIGEEADPLVVE